LLALARTLCQGAAMDTKPKLAGGCFLMATILIGFLGGVAIQDPIKGVLIGTAVGIAIAVAIWLVDRRRQP
jgi:hypothetical protein